MSVPYHLVTSLRVHCPELSEEFRDALKSVVTDASISVELTNDLDGNIQKSTLRCHDLVLLTPGTLSRIAEAEPGEIILVSSEPETLPDDIEAKLSENWVVNSGKQIAFHFRVYCERLLRENRMHIKELYLETMLATMPAICWFKNEKGDHFCVSNSFCHTVNKTREMIEGRRHPYIWDMDEEEYESSQLACKQTDAQALTMGLIGVSDELVKTSTGVHTFSIWKNAVRDDDGFIIGTAGIGNDVTGVNSLSAEINTLLRNLPFAVLVTDAQKNIINVNDRFRNLLKEATGLVLGDTLYSVSENRNTPFGSILDCRLREIVSNTNFEKDEATYLKTQKKPIFDRNLNYIGSILIFNDITKEFKSQLMLEKDAHEDPLTGLYNRRYFYSRNKVDQGGGILYLDLDHLKQLNDTMGHQIGDACLIAVSDVLRSVSSNAARLGGDEFAIYVNRATRCELESLARTIFGKITIDLSDSFNGVTPSIGIAITTGAHETLDDLVFRADVAMYANKRARARLYTLEHQHKLLSNIEGHSPEAVEVLEKQLEEQKKLVCPFTWYEDGMEEQMAKSEVYTSCRHSSR